MNEQKSNKKYFVNFYFNWFGQLYASCTMIFPTRGANYVIPILNKDGGISPAPECYVPLAKTSPGCLPTWRTLSEV